MLLKLAAVAAATLTETPTRAAPVKAKSVGLQMTAALGRPATHKADVSLSHDLLQLSASCRTTHAK